MAGRHVARRSGPRRLTTWFQFQPIALSQASSSGANLLFSLNAAALALRPFTIVRTYLEATLGSDQAGAIESQQIGLGMAVVSDQAVAIGITAVPTPITDMASPFWFLHRLIYADESSLAGSVRSDTRVSIDSKAMRKVEVGQDVIMVSEGAGLAAGFNLIVGGRLLIKNN